MLSALEQACASGDIETVLIALDQDATLLVHSKHFIQMALRYQQTDFAIALSRYLELRDDS